MEQHKKLTIHGHDVYFPHQPYPSQFSMMDKVLTSLAESKNALLESPTGTGKSLSLLCAALAWQKEEKERLWNEHYSYVITDPSLPATDGLSETNQNAKKDTPKSIPPSKPSLRTSLASSTENSELQANENSQEEAMPVDTTNNNNHPNNANNTATHEFPSVPVKHEPNPSKPSSKLKLKRQKEVVKIEFEEENASPLEHNTNNTEQHTTSNGIAQPQNSLLHKLMMKYKEEKKKQQAQQKESNSVLRGSQEDPIVLDEVDEVSTVPMKHEDPMDSDENSDNDFQTQKMPTPANINNNNSDNNNNNNNTSLGKDTIKPPKPKEPKKKVGTKDKPSKEPKPKNRKRSSEGEASNVPTRPSGRPKPPTIFFGSRTHSQIAQLVKELRNSAYRPVMCVLASRDHYCVHPTVSKSKNKSGECKKLLDTVTGCAYKYQKNRLVKSSEIAPGGQHEVWDIEDMVDLAHRMKGSELKIARTFLACPYFATQQIMQTAEIVFAPYNYLIDPIIRKSVDLDLTNSIIIIDEAHNIEDVSRSCASFDANLDAIEDTVHDLHGLLKTPLADLLQPLYSVMNGILSHVVASISTLKPEDFERHSNVWSGKEFVNVLDTLGVNQLYYGALEEIFENAMTQMSNSKGKLKFQTSTAIIIEGLLVIFSFLFMDNMKFVDDYKLVIQKEAVTEPGEKEAIKQRDRVSRSLMEYSTESASRSNKKWTYTVGLWCLNPQVAFDYLSRARSIILTSGTLSPLDSFASELGTNFPVRLEATHIIDTRTQLWAGIITKDQLVSFNSSYKTNESFQYQDAVGNAIVKFCREIPFGVLCFFPSYSLLNKLIARWKGTGVWNTLASIKKIVIEPQTPNDGEFANLMREYYEAIHNCQKMAGNGAIFFAVCRGKVSEGLDFIDNNARGVIAVGIPYPLIKDLKVILKKQYNQTIFDQQVKENPKEVKALNGGSRSWYMLQAFRAINQALGRCIRHSRDYGAILLLDERYAESSSRSKLSKWIRNELKVYNSVDETLSSLRTFFARHNQNNFALKKENVQNMNPNSLPPQNNNNNNNTRTSLTSSMPPLVEIPPVPSSVFQVVQQGNNRAVNTEIARSQNSHSSYVNQLHDYLRETQTVPTPNKRSLDFLQSGQNSDSNGRAVKPEPDNNNARNNVHSTQQPQSLQNQFQQLNSRKPPQQIVQPKTELNNNTPVQSYNSSLPPGNNNTITSAQSNGRGVNTTRAPLQQQVRKKTLGAKPKIDVSKLSIPDDWFDSKLASYIDASNQ